jgi:uncharacterized membrane protein YgdD (TMEM256/DUF423 family)
MNRALGTAAAALGTSALMLGAYGTHTLRAHAGADAFAIWEVGVDYQFFHTLAILAIAGFGPRGERWWARSGWAMVAGCVIFCGALYALALGAPPTVGMVPPLGALFLLAGWISAGIAFWCSASSK